MEKCESDKQRLSIQLAAMERELATAKTQINKVQLGEGYEYIIFVYFPIFILFYFHY